MRDRFIIFSFFLLFSSYSYNQTSYEAKYQVNFNNFNYDSILNQDNNIKNKKKTEAELKAISYLKEQFKTLLIIAQKINFKLIINAKSSLFLIEPILSLPKENIDIFSIYTSYNGKYFTFLNKTLNQKNSYGQDFIVSIPKFKWEITNEKRKIGEYNCYKATTVKEIENSKGINKVVITAWFASELPYNFGPKEYNGLPGLILELKEGKFLTYQLKELKKIKFTKINEPKQGEKISLKDFNILSKKMFENRKN